MAGCETSAAHGQAGAKGRTCLHNIEVRFFAHNFHHAFFTESVRGSGMKDRFNWQRARRMDWIATLLRDPSAEVYRRTMPPTLDNISGRIRRIALDPLERYVVIIAVERNLRRANFVTAYVVNSDSALKKMGSKPTWHK